MFLDETRDDAKLIHCDEEQLCGYKDIASSLGYLPHCNISQPSMLRQMAPTECYFVTDKRLMRGFDYRSKPIDSATSTI